MLFRIVKFMIPRVGFTYLCLVISIYLVTMVILVQKIELQDFNSKYSKDTICFRAHEITIVMHVHFMYNILPRTVILVPQFNIRVHVVSACKGTIYLLNLITWTLVHMY